MLPFTKRLNAGMGIIVLMLTSAAPAFAQLGDAVLSSPSPIVSVVVTPTIIVTPPADTTPPAISGVANLSLGLTDATIVWTTDELAISTLEYGTTQSYGSQATLGVTALLAHTAVLTGLAPGTAYYYCIHATDLSGNTANSCGHAFTAAAAPVLIDTTPPDVNAVTVTAITNSSVTINWTTDEIANAEIEYGLTAGYGKTTLLDTDLSLTHSVTITGLAPDTLYHYRIRSGDQIGNLATTPDNTFSTAPLSQNIGGSVPPSLTTSVIFSDIETASVGSSSVTIAWITDLPSDSQIEYGESEAFGTETPLSSTLTTTHAATITGLSPNTDYIFRVKSKPLGASIATVSTNYEFTTINHSTPIVSPANISSVSSFGVTGTSATITWNTDKPASSQVEYGISTSYGEASTPNNSLATSHSVSLTKLVPNTTYHFRAQSNDEDSNITFSEDYTFTTPAMPQSAGFGGVATSAISIAPTALTTLAIGGYDENSVELIWHVSPANTDITAEYDVRYSASPITDSNFQNATPAQSTPIYHQDLDSNGTERRYIVPGLSASTAYYFAVKSKFLASSYSTISNTVSVILTAGASINNENVFEETSSGNSILQQEIDSFSASIGASGSTGVMASYGKEEGSNAAASFGPTLVKAEPADSQIIFSWRNPNESNFVRTVVIRKDGSYPTSPSDGQVLYEGRSETFADINVRNDTTYYYAVYSYNHGKIYSAPVRVSVAPKTGNKEVKFNESGSLEPTASIFHFIRAFKKGDKDIEIEHLQEILTTDGESYPEKYITGYFGSLTEAALKRFQSKHGLPQSGVVDTATQKELNTISHSETKLEIPTDYAVFNADLKYGDQSEAVKDLQTYLIYEGGYAEALITGYFGNYTKAAVMKFQKKYGITPISGYVGYKTRHKMQQLTGL